MTDGETCLKYGMAAGALAMLNVLAFTIDGDFKAAALAMDIAAISLVVGHSWGRRGRSA